MGENKELCLEQSETVKNRQWALNKMGKLGA